jgi:23S rRNA pseudouridine2457 synthase
LLVLFNKPYGVVCQFSPHASRPTLKDFVVIPNLYPAGRLDWDSEGLVVLTDDGKLQHRISNPSGKMEKTYWVQVEGEATDVAIQRLAAGIEINGVRTRPARATRIGEPTALGPRDPPIRYRKHITTSWLEIRLSEGRNRQVRRMTAATGFPTLRLIRSSIGPWTLAGLASGAYREIEKPELSIDLRRHVNRP